MPKPSWLIGQVPMLAGLAALTIIYPIAFRWIYIAQIAGAMHTEVKMDCPTCDIRKRIGKRQ